jgi:hypothetical protein
MSSPFCKNILLRVLPKSLLNPSLSRPERGALRNVINAGRDAVAAAALKRVRDGRAGFMACERSNGALTKDAVADGQVVWF